MMAIHTKFLGPTNFRGARYKAVAGDGGKGFELTVGQDDAIDSEANHYRAARMLIDKLEWFHDENRGDRYGCWYGGSTGDGYVFVCAVDYAELRAVAAPVQAQSQRPRRSTQGRSRATQRSTGSARTMRRVWSVWASRSMWSGSGR